MVNSETTNEKDDSRIHLRSFGDIEVWFKCYFHKQEWREVQTGETDEDWGKGKRERVAGTNNMPWK